MELLAARCLQLVGVMDLSLSMGDEWLLHGLPCSGLDHGSGHHRISLHLLWEWGRGRPQQTPCLTHFSVHQLRSDAAGEAAHPVPRETQP